MLFSILYISSLHILIRSIYFNTNKFPLFFAFCFPRWEVLPGSPCNATCGGGWEEHQVICKRRVASHLDERLTDDMCPAATKPPTLERCNADLCNGSWDSYNWTEVRIDDCSAGVYGVSIGNETRRPPRLQCPPLSLIDINQCKDVSVALHLLLKRLAQ